MQLGWGGAGKAGEFALVALGDENKRRRSQVQDIVNRNGEAADWVDSTNVKCEHVGLTGATWVTALDRGSNVGARSLAKAVGRANAGGVDRVVSKAVESVAGCATIAASAQAGVGAAGNEQGILRANHGCGHGYGSSRRKYSQHFCRQSLVGSPEVGRDLIRAAARENRRGSVYGALGLGKVAAGPDHGVNLGVRPHLREGGIPYDPDGTRVRVGWCNAGVGKADDVGGAGPVAGARSSLLIGCQCNRLPHGGSTRYGCLHRGCSFCQGPDAHDRGQHQHCENRFYARHTDVFLSVFLSWPVLPRITAEGRRGMLWTIGQGTYYVKYVDRHSFTDAITLHKGCINSAQGGRRQA